MDKLRFGPSGIPPGNKGTEAGIQHIASRSLNAMELAFVRQVYLTAQSASPVKRVAQNNDVTLTAHAPYFVNLNAQDHAKLRASQERIKKTARIGQHAGCWSIVFHAGFYLKQNPTMVYETIRKNLKEVTQSIQDEGNKVWIRPETTGKATQFGNLKEVVKLSQDIEQVLPCIDFSHLHARSAGQENTKFEFHNTLAYMEKELGRNALDNMHIHVSGIAYTHKGERHHLNLQDSDMNYKDLTTVWREFNIKGVVISESPNQDDDAVVLQKHFRK